MNFKSKSKIIINVLFLIGAFLVSIDIAGVFIPLRNPSIYYEKKNKFDNDITLSDTDVFSKLDSLTNDKKQSAVIINETINKGIAHYWDTEGINKYNIRVPFFNNYLLYLYSFIKPDTYLMYEFMDSKRAIIRGIGLCSQQSIILSEILKVKNIKNELIGLSGRHVVVHAQVNEIENEWWVLDPDYGVIVPHRLSTITNNPSSIINYYQAAGYNKQIVDNLVGIYASNSTVIISKNGAKDYAPKRYYIEYLSYVLIWLIPFILMTPLVVNYIRIVRRLR